MSTDSGQDDLPKILARAFLHAWERYRESDLAGKHCEEVGRPFLKGLLAEFAKGGVTDEEQLVAAGLQYLISVTRKPTSSKCSTKEEEKTPEDGGRHLHFCINGAPAKFLFQWRKHIPLGNLNLRSAQKKPKVRRHRHAGAGAGALFLSGAIGHWPAPRTHQRPSLSQLGLLANLPEVAADPVSHSV